jgi:hypothetical protein
MSAYLSEDKQVTRSTWTASTWRIETTQGSPELSIGTCLPFCGEILNNADSREKAGMIIDRHIRKICDQWNDGSDKAANFAIEK